MAQHAFLIEDWFLLGSMAAPLAGIGIIADVQYADADDGMSRKGTLVRHYRGALAQAASAVDLRLSACWSTVCVRIKLAIDCSSLMP